MRRERYLKAMGIPVWVLRDTAAEGGDEPGATPDASTAAHATAAPAVGPLVGAQKEPGAAMPESAAVPVDESPAAQVCAAPSRSDVANADWETLARTVRDCMLCELHRTRTQTVFGVGRRDAELLVIGEAPGADEDRQGEPFVGRAGQLLNAMLAAIGFARSDVYIANILKCRPPGNRDPRPEEQASCAPYLERQVELIAPRAVLALGRVAAQWLLQSDQTIGRLRGRVLHFGPSRIPIVVTYHPAYLLRSPLAKQKSWQDLCMIKDLVTSKP